MLPPFFAGNFNTTILENTAVGVALKTVIATDNDPQVILTTIPRLKAKNQNDREQL